MSTDFAPWRKRVTRLLDPHRLGPGPQRPPSDTTPTLPSITPHLFKLAHLAVGDADSAAVLLADVLALHGGNPDVDEATALLQLVERLPDGWLSWPGGAGPGEWLALGLRREQADRLLSVLGEWGPQDRIGLALYLLWDVRRDDLDSWLGTHGMADHIGWLINYVGDGLDLAAPAGTTPACKETAPDLIDARDPQVGRTVRRHTMGCDACRRRVDGLRQTADVLRIALNVFFRTPPLPRLPQLVVERRKLLRQPQFKQWKPLVAVAAVLLLWALMFRQPPAGAAPAPPPPAPRDAYALLNRALNKFEQDAPRTGILHERVRFLDQDQPLLLERWYGYGRSPRLRITITRPGSATPILDLATDGTEQVAYQLDYSYRSPANALIRNPDVAQLMPLLRQLPVTGSLGDSRIDQRNLDLPLLAQAWRSKNTLLGTTLWRNRPAYLLSSTRPGQDRMILTIDEQTGGLLEVRRASDAGGTATTSAVWQAELVEVVPTVPSSIFVLPPRETVIPQINPRRFMLQPLSNVDVNTALRISTLAVPQYLPEPSLLSYIRTRDRGSSVVQMYEGQWSSVAILTPDTLVRTPLVLDESFRNGRYTLVPHALPNTTIIEFILNGAGNRRMRLYYWHGLSNDTERTAQAKAILESLVPVDTNNNTAYLERFLDPPTAVPSGSAVTRPRLTRTGSAGVRLRYMHAKLTQPTRTNTIPAEFIDILER